jgi:hypothetical protein
MPKQRILFSAGQEFSAGPSQIASTFRHSEVCYHRQLPEACWFNVIFFVNRHLVSYLMEKLLINWSGKRTSDLLSFPFRYGDITPLSVPGKFLVMIMIIISLAFVGYACAPVFSWSAGIIAIGFVLAKWFRLKGRRDEEIDIRRQLAIQSESRS